MQNRLIIGLVGHPSCGKDTVAEYLVQKHGFLHVSTGDLVRADVKKRNLGEPTRELLGKVAKEMRDKQGLDVLIRHGVETHKNTPKIVFGGIRVAAEGAATKRLGGKILAITAPIELRYQWAKERGRIGEESFERFKANEERESANPDPAAQNVNAVIAMADITIENTGTLQELLGKIDSAITLLS